MFKSPVVSQKLGLINPIHCFLLCIRWVTVPGQQHFDHGYHLGTGGFAGLPVDGGGFPEFVGQIMGQRY